ncbi:hypothetical protein RS030_81366 [Cryptosporidium xiaoi]|uniref:Uncharacterized protein n=1 Tax=Cryptosporidium xiaoi TaxID=659607 RepID=A0AAV9XZF1_9CRYT
MSLKTPDKKQSSRRRKKDLSIDNICTSPGSANNIVEKNSNKTYREDPGALILKLLHNGRRSVVKNDISLTSNSFRSQSRTKHCGPVIPLVETSDKQPDNVSDIKVPENNTSTLFTTPPPNRKGRYSLFSTCGTNNQKCTNYSNGGNEKSLTSSSSSNPTNFALPMYMRSPNPENIPMPCGFPIES